MQENSLYFWHVFMDSAPSAEEVSRFVGSLPVPGYRVGVRWWQLSPRSAMFRADDLEGLVDGLVAAGEATVSLRLQSNSLTVYMDSDEFGNYRIGVYSTSLVAPEPGDYWAASPGFLGANFGAYHDYADHLNRGIGVDGEPWTGRGGWPVGSDYPAASVWCPANHPIEGVIEQCEFERRTLGTTGITRTDIFDLGDTAARIDQQKRRYGVHLPAKP